MVWEMRDEKGIFNDGFGWGELERYAFLDVDAWSPSLGSIP
jgi:hypothetical protein